MTWASRDYLVSLALVVSVLTAVALAFRHRRAFFGHPHQGYHNALLFLGAGLIGFCSSATITPALQSISRQAYDMSAAMFLRPSTMLGHGGLVLTLGAICWLLYRAWQTVSIPAPKLMDILRIDVPVAPELVIYDIKTTSASIYWTKPPPGKPVERFRVQINGVIVGETSGTETAATVSGLRPNHFYNLQVIAVGPNNFHTASAVIRMQTFAENGKPDLGHARVPTSLLLQLQRASAQPEPSKEPKDDADPPSTVPSVESATADRPKPPNPTTSTTGGALVIAGQRRGTLNRRHSPSAGNQEGQRRSPQSPGAAAERELSYAELNDKFKKLQAEKDEATALFSREEKEFQEQEHALKGEKEEKKLLLKEKEEKSVKLKAKVRSSREQSRASTRALDKAKGDLTSKKSAQDKARVNIANLEAETAAMRKKREALAAERDAFEKSTAAETARLADDIATLSGETAKLETELADKGKTLNARKDAKKEAAGNRDDLQWREEDARLRRESEHRKKELDAQIAFENKRSMQLDRDEAHVQAQISRHQQQRQPSGHESDLTTMKRSIRPANPLPGIIVPSAASDAFGFSIQYKHGIGPGQYMEPADMAGSDGVDNEHDSRIFRVPLSPSAHNLLPSDILNDEGVISPSSESHMSIANVVPPFRLEPQSPSPSSLSLAMAPSPHGSTHNLPGFNFPTDAASTRESSGASISAPAPPPGLGAGSGHKLSSFFSSLRRKPSAEMSPSANALKPTPSRSFLLDPEDEFVGSRRRVSISGNLFGRSSTGPDMSQVTSHPHAHSRAMSARRINQFTGLPMYGDRDTASPRPASIASDPFRPSIDGTSIWSAAPGDTASLRQGRMWPEGGWHSRNPSRRPSFHTSPELKTSLASPDDEILYDEAFDPTSKPSYVGVIGSRPPAHQAKPRLNPNAPTFMGGLFKKSSDSEGDDDASSIASKDAAKNQSMALAADEWHPRSTKPRDAVSLYAIRSDSRESLGIDSSDFEMVPEPLAKDADNVVRKLFRKGSSNKFGTLSSRLGRESGLFKKGPGSAVSQASHGLETSDAFDSEASALGEESVLGRSFDSTKGSMPSGPSKGAKDTAAALKEGGNTGRWRFPMKKKGRGEAKESVDLGIAGEVGATGEVRAE